MPLLKKWSLRTTKKPQKQKRYPWSPCRVRHGQRLLPRHGHTVVVHATLGLLVYGGIHKAKKDVVCIDPVTLNTRILTTSGSRPSSRIHATTTLFGNYLYLYGGQCLDPSLPWDTNLYILNLESQRWTVMQTMRGIGARAGHTMVASHGMAYIWGGKRPDGSLVNEMCIFALHRGLQGDWDTIHLDYKPVARSHHCAVVSERNMFM
ncbi:hypothetical protein BC940DRAFT_41706 [Gongronella butleri]|nr:hypothetical protein BC940DRAFT_41706 [Gongronella butleri]